MILIVWDYNNVVRVTILTLAINICAIDTVRQNYEWVGKMRRSEINIYHSFKAVSQTIDRWSSRRRRRRFAMNIGKGQDSLWRYGESSIFTIIRFCNADAVAYRRRSLNLCSVGDLLLEQFTCLTTILKHILNTSCPYTTMAWLSIYVKWTYKCTSTACI